MPRPSVLTVVYDEKFGAIEGDYVITAFFDTAGRLVGKDINESIR
jgi:hypothetical protein